MTNSLISVIIINYNGEKWLKKCLDSLFSQTYQNFEIILVDNNSTDNSLRFLSDNYSNTKLKIIRNSNNDGFAGGNNLGINFANGEFILLLNNDTWIYPDFLDNIYKHYINNNYDIIAPHQADYMDPEKKYELSLKIDLMGHHIILDKNMKSFYLCGVCLFFKKELYLETRGLDENFFMYFEETDWFWRLNLLNKRFSYIENLYVYHYGGGSVGDYGMKYKNFLWRNQNCLQMLLKNYKWFNLLWILPIYVLQNLFEMIFFLIILKPKIAFSYIEGWLFNIKNLKKILERRRWIQNNRLIGDVEILKKMFIGFAKIHHLISFIKQNGGKKSL